MHHWATSLSARGLRARNGRAGGFAIPIDRTIEDEGRDNPADPNPGDEGRCLPVSMRDADTQPLPARAAPMCASHVRRGPGLVDENETLGIKVELALESVLSPLQDVGTILLACVCGLFLRVSLWRLQKRHSAAMLNCAPDFASRSFSSGKVMSGVSTRRARIRSPRYGLTSGKVSGYRLCDSLDVLRA